MEEEKWNVIYIRTNIFNDKEKHIVIPCDEGLKDVAPMMRRSDVGDNHSYNLSTKIILNAVNDDWNDWSCRAISPLDILSYLKGIESLSIPDKEKLTDKQISWFEEKRLREIASSINKDSNRFKDCVQTTFRAITDMTIDNTKYEKEREYYKILAEIWEPYLSKRLVYFQLTELYRFLRKHFLEMNK